MRLTIATLLIVATGFSSVFAKEELLRRRRAEFEARQWESGNEESFNEQAEFYRNNDYNGNGGGYPSDYEAYGKGTKSIKGKGYSTPNDPYYNAKSSKSKGPKSLKGPKGPKGDGKGNEGKGNDGKGGMPVYQPVAPPVASPVAHPAPYPVSDPTPYPTALCGNGALDGGEQCDPRSTVVGWGCYRAEYFPLAPTGGLSCNEYCMCTGCGNEILDGGDEQCEPEPAWKPTGGWIAGHCYEGQQCNEKCMCETKPTASPTKPPTPAPTTPEPTKKPTAHPTPSPTYHPTPAPITPEPTKKPTSHPTEAPTPFCGDGHLDIDLGEECDKKIEEGDGGCLYTLKVKGLTCTHDCTCKGCGNGRIDFGEECELKDGVVTDDSTCNMYTQDCVDCKCTPKPTPSPTYHPTPAPITPEPTKTPTAHPTPKPVDPTHAPVDPTNSPTYSPTPYPTPSPTECPEPELPKTCKPHDNADTCDAHTTCDYACIPLMCKLPDDPHKIHGPGYTPDDRYVPLGSLCGYMRYVEGYTSRGESRHDVEVCCEVDESYHRHPHYDDEGAQCTGCQTCKFPQKVSDACCKIAKGYDGNAPEDVGRYGDYGPACGNDKPICCKCGENSYTCIGEEDHCSHDSCPAPPTGTIPPTPEPTPGPTPKPTHAPATPKPTPQPTKMPTKAPTDKPTPAPTSKPTNSCGNGIVDYEEECDLSVQGSGYDGGCDEKFHAKGLQCINCECIGCGNKYLDHGEQCDLDWNGNFVEGSVCKSGKEDCKNCKCEPKYCTVPENPDKIHGFGGGGGVVEIGDACGYFKYVTGSDKPRSPIEVCCNSLVMSTGAYEAQCVGCESCSSFQEVSDGCCAYALDQVETGEEMGRDGYFGGCPGELKCCKCGYQSYKCIEQGAHCNEATCNNAAF